MCGIGVILSNYSEDLLSLQGQLNVLLANRGPDGSQSHEIDGLHFIGSVLHIQGSCVTIQPVIDECGDVLVWNGEVFGGIESHSPGSSDTLVVARLLAESAATYSNISEISEAISESIASIQGPYAFIYYHLSSKTLFFARDPIGRRSLLTLKKDNQILCIASVTVPFIPQAEEDQSGALWSEVDVEGVYSLHNGSLSCTKWPAHRVKLQRLTIGEPLISTDENCSQMLFEKLKCAARKRVLCLNRPSSGDSGLAARHDDTCGVGVLFSGGLDSVVLAALLHLCVDNVTAAIELINVTFIGANNKKKADSPDRLAAIAALIELQELFPSRQWRMVHVDVESSDREDHDAHIKSLIYPSDSHMDLNIGTAFWFASRGVGYLQTHHQSEKEATFSVKTENKHLLRLGSDQVMPQRSKNNSNAGDDSQPAIVAVVEKVPCGRLGCKRIQKVGCCQSYCKDCCIKTEMCRECTVHRKYLKKSQLAASNAEGDPQPIDDAEESSTSSAAKTPYTARCRALLVGIGADEQMGGYGRHRTCFNRGGFDALREELHLDQNRLWSRNLGRDDRCIADNGREAWFPYLDEEVVQYLQQLPLSKIVDYSLPPGVGDKKILRDVGKQLGLRESADLVKRAIQFGTGIAKNTNVEYFGSNRKGSGGTKF